MLVSPSAGAQLYHSDDFATYKAEKVNVVSDGKYLCLLCGAVLAVNFTLKRHFTDKHTWQEFVFTCPSSACAGKTFDTKTKFANHVYYVHKDYRGMDLMSCATRVQQ